MVTDLGTSDPEVVTKELLRRWDILSSQNTYLMNWNLIIHFHVSKVELQGGEREKDAGGHCCKQSEGNCVCSISFLGF